MAVTWQEFRDLAQYAMVLRRPGLVVHDGDVSDGFLCAVASCADAAVARGIAGYRASTVSGGEGDDLTGTCHDRGVDRDEGAQSVGTVTFERAAATAGAGTIPAGFRVATGTLPDGSTAIYTTDIDLTLGALALTGDVTATAQEIGQGGNVDIGEVQVMLDTPFDTSLSVTNADRMVGGREAQGDEDLRDETRAFPATQRRGTAAAILFGAKTVPQVVRASLTVNELTAEIDLYVADLDGNSNPAMLAAVEAVMPDWKGTADIVTVRGGSVQYEAITATVYLRAGYVLASLSARLASASVARLARLLPGETFYRQMAELAMVDVEPEGIYRVVVTLPATDVVPPSESVSIRTLATMITLVQG